MDESEIYKATLVADVIFDAEENNVDSLKNKSREMFLYAVDDFKNKNNPAVAIDLFKESILIFPDPKTYYELGNALLSTGLLVHYKEALEAFKVAEQLNFQPIASVYYKQACANNLIYNSGSIIHYKEGYLRDALSYLKQAFKNGYLDTIAIGTDARLSSLTKSADYRKMVFEFVNEKSGNGSNAFFNLCYRPEIG